MQECCAPMHKGQGMPGVRLAIKGPTCDAEMLAEVGAEGNRRDSGESGSRTEASGKEATQ